MTTEERNKKVSDILEECFVKAKNGNFQKLPSNLQVPINNVFSSTVWGFREILLVIAIAKLLDDSYRPSEAFYKCNPRALYEGPIRDVLLRLRIPHKKSGPLNVAKAAVGINLQWAAQRRPANIAHETVKLVIEIEKLNKQELFNFAINMAELFLNESSRVAELSIEVPPQSDVHYLYTISKSLIQEVPDAGNTPQRIIGVLMLVYHEELQSGIKVVGYLDRASVTSTTSKKPGDITEEQLDGTIIKTYEVTVKPFHQSRVIESYDTIKQFENNTKTKIDEITVICREGDQHPDAENTEKEVYLGKLQYNNVTYQFIEINSWILGQLNRMTQDARVAFYMKLNDYIDDPNTSEQVKRFWQALHKS